MYLVSVTYNGFVFDGPWYEADGLLPAHYLHRHGEGGQKDALRSDSRDDPVSSKYTE